MPPGGRARVAGAGRRRAARATGQRRTDCDRQGGGRGRWCALEREGSSVRTSATRGGQRVPAPRPPPPKDSDPQPTSPPPTTPWARTSARWRRGCARPVMNAQPVGRKRAAADGARLLRHSGVQLRGGGVVSVDENLLLPRGARAGRRRAPDRSGYRRRGRRRQRATLRARLARLLPQPRLLALRCVNADRRGAVLPAAQVADDGDRAASCARHCVMRVPRLFDLS